MPSEKSALRELVLTGAKFGVVGLTTVGLYFVVLALARPFIANVVALSLFGSTPTGARLVRYILMHLLCMGMNATLIHLLIERMGVSFYPAQILVTFAVAGTSFVLSRLWVYR